jgi:hypothetical protein
MPEDYYPTEQAEEPTQPPEKDVETNTDSETALMPKALLGDVAVGDTVTLKVVHIYEDEIEVEKVTDEQTEKRPQFESEIDDMSSDEE